jgi:DNA-binding beta-propeller fold protein YncE
VLVSTQSELAFQVVADWEKAPAGLVHKDVADVTVDAQDRVYLFTRMDPQVVVYDADGNHITTWGRDVFTPRPHGIKAAPNGNIYCVDEFDQTVRVFTPDGQLLQTIGESGIESDTGIDWSYPYANFYERCKAIVRGGAPFNHPTKAAVTRDDHVYVSDGYGNTRIHHFSPTGELLHSWGEPGPEPGNFRAPHCVAVHDGLIWVCDRENERIQLFDFDGNFQEEWTDVRRPSSIAFDRDGLVYISEQGWKAGDYSWRNGLQEEALPARIGIFTRDGDLVTRLGEDDGMAFYAPHGIAVDSSGSIYVAEVIGAWFADEEHPDDLPTIQKIARV